MNSFNPHYAPMKEYNIIPIMQMTKLRLGKESTMSKVTQLVSSRILHSKAFLHTGPHCLAYITSSPPNQLCTWRSTCLIFQHFEMKRRHPRAGFLESLDTSECLALWACFLAWPWRELRRCFRWGTGPPGSSETLALSLTLEFETLA